MKPASLEVHPNHRENNLHYTLSTVAMYEVFRCEIELKGESRITSIRIPNTQGQQGSDPKDNGSLQDKFK